MGVSEVQHRCPSRLTFRTAEVYTDSQSNNQNRKKGLALDNEAVDMIPALNAVLKALDGLSKEDKTRLLRAVAMFLDLGIGETFSANSYPTVRISTPEREAQNFAEDRAPSPKAFLRDKQPRTDIERIACLAYYLTHYRSQPHFKTVDLSALNTEAAQPKFSNASFSADNASKAGFLVPAGKGSRQLTSGGEAYVSLLPDHAAAAASRKTTRIVRRPKRPATLRNAASSSGRAHKPK